MDIQLLESALSPLVSVWLATNCLTCLSILSVNVLDAHQSNGITHLMCPQTEKFCTCFFNPSLLTLADCQPTIKEIFLLCGIDNLIKWASAAEGQDQLYVQAVCLAMPNMPF